MQALKKLTSRLNLRRFEPGIWAAAGIQAIRSTAFSICFTYLPLYLYQQRHIPMTLVGVIILTSGVMSAVSQVVGGMAADRFGHRRMFIVYQIAGLVTLVVLAVLIGADAAVWSIIVVAILAPTPGAMASPTVSAIVADISPGNRMTESYGLLAIGGNIGWAIGPLAGGYLLSAASYAWLFGAGVLISSFSLIGIPFLPRGSGKGNSESFSVRSLKSFVSNSTLIVFCVVSMLFFLDMAQWGSTLSVFTVDRIGFSPEQYGVLMTISGVLIIVFQYPISRRIEWFGTRKALFLGSFLYGAGFLSLSWVKAFIPAVGSIVILVAGEMLFVPTALAVVGKISRPEDRGKNMGFFGLCETFGSSLGPLLGGFLLDRFPAEPLYLWGPIALSSFAAASGFALWQGYSQAEVAGDLAVERQNGVTK